MSDNNELVQALICEQLDENNFRGVCRDFGGGHLYGGQAMAQALSAAQATVSNDRNIHTMYANFLRSGDASLPVIYEVEKSRDGFSYSSRRIIGSQNGKEIIHVSASFRDDDNSSGIYKSCEPPVHALDLKESEFEAYKRHWHADLMEARTLLGSDSTQHNVMQTWLRAKKTLPDQQSLHSALLTYLSDISILPSHIPVIKEVNRDSAKATMTSYMMSSLNHAIWFHRPFKVDDWLYYECTPEYTASNRGLAHGRFYSPDGTLIASATQEGMIKPLSK